MTAPVAPGCLELGHEQLGAITDSVLDSITEALIHGTDSDRRATMLSELLEEILAVVSWLQPTGTPEVRSLRDVTAAARRHEARMT